MEDKEFIDVASNELIKMGIIEKNNILDSHREKVKKAYPAYFDTYSRMDELIKYLDSFPNLYCIGRNGQHRYNNMDHSMVTAFEAVKNIKNDLSVFFSGIIKRTNQIDEALIAILKVYYKSEKRHPDTNNITKSIFDGIEKSGLIVNDVQIRRIIIEEFYDKENPRFELELFGESEYSIDYKIVKNSTIKPKTIYSSNKKITSSKNTNKNTITKPIDDTNKTCSICGKTIKSNDFITANKGKTVICRKCLSKTF